MYITTAKNVQRKKKEVEAQQSAYRKIATEAAEAALFLQDSATDESYETETEDKTELSSSTTSDWEDENMTLEEELQYLLANNYI